MYLIDKNAELTPLILGKILNRFQMVELPKMNRFYKYYKGEQAITLKKPTDTGKPANKVITNFCHTITDTYEGYLTGVPIQYSNDKEFDEILDILSYNDVKNEDSEYLRQALIYGRAFEICYIDEDNKQRFRTLDARECIPVYDNTLNNNLLYVIRFWCADIYDKTNEEYIVEVYGAKDTKRYKSNIGFSSFTLIEELPNYYGQCPITVFSLNTEEESIFNSIMSLQDAYNTLLSSEIDDWESFCDAYMVLKGSIIDEEEMENMKKHRLLIMDNDAEASYLTKDVNDTQIRNMLQLVNDNIHKIACCPDFSQESFGTSSGIALRYRLLGFENNAAAIESNFKMALQRRIELLSAIVNLAGGDSLWRDVSITFHRNLPVNLEETSTILNNLRGLVSDETLLTQIPFISDVEEELKKLAKQKEAAMALYKFENPAADDEEEE